MGEDFRAFMGLGGWRGLWRAATQSRADLREGEILSYGVAEPYTLYVGGTLGIEYERKNGLLPVFGVWEAVPVVQRAASRIGERTSASYLR